MQSNLVPYEQKACLPRQREYLGQLGNLPPYKQALPEEGRATAIPCNPYISWDSVMNFTTTELGIKNLLIFEIYLCEVEHDKISIMFFLHQTCLFDI